MARIRTIKPEAFVSESLAEVSVTAERTFFGLLTQADDQGRHRDHAAIIAGLLWPLRPEHTPVDVAEDLQQLQVAGLICRYTGCDGRSYLHVVKWAEHQKIDRPSQSRLPACPEHQAEQRCGGCRTSGCGSGGNAALDEPLARHAPRLDEGSPNARGIPATRSADSGSRPGASAPASQVTAGEDSAPAARQGCFDDDSSSTLRALDEPSPPGSRIVDPGSTAPSERGASAPAVSARALIGEYIAACPNRPPRRVLGHLGREINQLLAEGIDAAHIRSGLERFSAKPMHPSVLPSLVNEAMNARRGSAAERSGLRPGGTGHRAWANPADAGAYAEEL